MKSRASFDHLVSAGEQRRRHGKAERLRRDQIDDKFKFRRMLDWYIAGLRPAKNFIHVICRAPEPFRVTWSIGHETPAADKITDNGDDRCCLPYRGDSATDGDNYVDLHPHELGGNFGVTLRATLRPTILDRDVTVLDPAQFA